MKKTLIAAVFAGALLQNPFIGEPGICGAEQIQANVAHEIYDYTFGTALTGCIIGSQFGYNSEFASPKASLVNVAITQGRNPSEVRGQWGQ